MGRSLEPKVTVVPMANPAHDLGGALLRLASQAEALPAAARDRLAGAVLEADGRLAVIEVAALLDPNGSRARWAVAGDLATRLDRFASTAWGRIRAGARAPQGPIEEALGRILAAGGPRSQRRLADLI
jgi:hypothetical protein